MPVSFQSSVTVALHLDGSQPLGDGVRFALQGTILGRKATNALPQSGTWFVSAAAAEAEKTSQLSTNYV